MNRLLTLGAISVALCANNTVLAGDARSMALGNAVIANAKGVHGAMANPASMMAMKRRTETIHLRFGLSAEVRDTGNTIKTLTDAADDNVISEIDAEIEKLSTQELTCDPDTDIAVPDCLRLTGTQGLFELSNRVLEIIDTLDEESTEGFATADLGIAYTQSRFPFAVNLRVSAAGTSTPDVVEGDRNYVLAFIDAVDDDELTFTEAVNSSVIQVGAIDGTTVPLTEVLQPDDVLASEVSSAVLLRAQLGVSLATMVTVGDLAIDVGITPKISSLIAQSADVVVGDAFEEDGISLADKLTENEVTESSFTADVGASMLLPDKPVQIAAVIRNLIPESVTSLDGVEFETTTQLVLGAAFHHRKLTISGDIALNEAKQDGFATQKIGLGVEFGTRHLAIRGGVSHDAAREEDNTALSLGFGLGPLQIGGRLSGIEAMELGAQLAYSFR